MTQTSALSTGNAKPVDVALFRFISSNSTFAVWLFYGWFDGKSEQCDPIRRNIRAPSSLCKGDWACLYYCQLRAVWPQYLLTCVWPCCPGKHTLHAENSQKRNSVWPRDTSQLKSMKAQLLWISHWTDKIRNNTRDKCVFSTVDKKRLHLTKAF